jgi:hypothetical protein
VRFEVSRVLDTIEQRLTTDVALAQAVVDLSDVTRFGELDGGRPVNLLRLGMVLDALARYLVDGGAMLYAVTGRELLAETALTSKERMVLGRWTDDGVIEATPEVGDRVVEIADFTGMPVIACRDYGPLAERFDWLVQTPERVLRLVPRPGRAVLLAAVDGGPVPLDGAQRAVATVTLVAPKKSIPPAGDTAPTAPPGDVALLDAPVAGAQVVDEPAASEEAPVDVAATDVAVTEAAVTEAAATEAAATEAAATEAAAAPRRVGTASRLLALRAKSGIFLPRVREPQIRISTRAIEPAAAPSSLGAALLARSWRCPEFDCPNFGEFRRPGQPVPRMRGGVPVCPRHGEPVTDIGPRPAEHPVALVIDDVVRLRFPVTSDAPVIVGRAPTDPDQGIGLDEWLHHAARAWIAAEHARLEISDERLVVTDLGDNGTVVWRREESDGSGEPVRLHAGQSRTLGRWDSVELYTGIELVPGNRRIVGGPVAVSDARSVLADAPTVANRVLSSS